MVKLTLALHTTDGRPATYYSGDVVQGHLTVHADKPLQTRSLHVQLVGVEKTEVGDGLVCATSRLPVPASACRAVRSAIRREMQDMGWELHIMSFRGARDRASGMNAIEQW